MKNLIGYIFAFPLCAFFMGHLSHSIGTCNCTNPLMHSGNMFAYAMFLLGFFCSACGIIVETYKGILNLINPNK
jgi:biotin transporter BioY